MDRFVTLIVKGNAPERVLEKMKARELRVKKLGEELAQLQVAQPLT